MGINPLGDDTVQMIIDFDKHSLIFDNKRTLINSAAFHYFRCPGIETWRDRLSKLKAAGYNTVDLYFCWGYHSSKQGVYDFTGIKDVRALLDLTVELGLFVIARPGPFINAEVSFGGLPPWLLNIPDIIIRNKKGGDFVYSEPYMKALKEWYSRIIPIINEYHNIIAFQIENEYFTNEAEPNYLQELYDLSRSLGIKVPIFHNDALAAGLYSDIVNIYAFDVYPTISFDYDWKDFPDSFGTLDNAESNLADCCNDSPLFIAELQAGWFDKWGGIGYENIWPKFKKEHINIVTKTTLSQGITMFNHYMGCGGTSWDKLASSEVYTSYDFAAPVSESGIPRENYYKAKEINYLLNSFNFSSTDLISEGADVIGEDKENVFARLRKDNLNNCNWLFIRNLNKEEYNSKILDKYNLKIKPFDMKIIPVDLNLKACKIDFSSFEIFGRVESDNNEIIFLMFDENSEIFISEYDLLNTAPSSLIFDTLKSDQYKEKDGILTIESDNISDMTSFTLKNQAKTTQFVFLNSETADKTWIFNNKVLIGPDFMTHNLKKAAFSEDIEVKFLDLESHSGWRTKYIRIEQDEKRLPELINWKAFKCAPEIDVNYDYLDWNYLKENKRFDCISNEVYDDYIWYKASFKHTPNQIEINAKHCYAVYLNGNQIYSHDTFAYDHGHELSETITFEIDKKYSHPSGKNELTVLVQSLGFDKGFQNELVMPRGIISLKTIPEKEIEWKIRGGLTPLIEEWDFVPERDLEDASENPYLIWLTAGFKFEKNNNKYSPFVLDLEEAGFNKADIYLNGNLIGRFWPSKSPQTKFYLPDEFLNPDNKLSLIIWNREDNSHDYKDYKSDEQCVKIKIRNIKTFDLISISEVI